MNKFKLLIDFVWLFTALLIDFVWLFTGIMSFRRSLVPRPPAGAHRLAYLLEIVSNFEWASYRTVSWVYVSTM